jgi:cytidylate kinase
MIYVDNGSRTNESPTKGGSAMKNDPYIVAGFLEAKEREKWKADGTSPIVTISRQRGAEGQAVALRTAEILSEMTHGLNPWIVVDKDLAERVIEDHHLPKRIGRFFTEEQTLSIEEHLEGLFGISVPSATRIQDMTRTIINLARLGHVIFVGRAAHVITANFPRAVHVRVIGSFKRRVERLMEIKKYSWDEAAAEVKTVDHQRHHFVSTHFRTDIEDPLRYDMIFNTDRVSVEESARLIAHLVSSPEFRDEKARRLVELRHQVLG